MVTKKVLLITAINPKGAINKIIKVIAPFTMAIAKFRTTMARVEIYMIAS
jgi:hypothetical protein